MWEGRNSADGCRGIANEMRYKGRAVAVKGMADQSGSLKLECQLVIDTGTSKSLDTILGLGGATEELAKWVCLVGKQETMADPLLGSELL